MNLLGHSLLTATAVAPVVLVYAIIALIDKDLVLAIALFVTCVILVGSCLGLLIYIRAKTTQSTILITAIDSADRESLGIMLLYLMPFIRLSPSDLTWELLVPSIVLFLSLVASGTGFYFNPLLNFFGWHFYKVDTPEHIKHVLITKNRFRNVKRSITVSELAKYTLVESRTQ